LSEEAVQRTLQAVDAASQSKNVEEVLKYVAPFAYLELTLEGPGYSQTTGVIGKDQIRERLQKAFERIASSEYLDKSQKIDVLADEQVAIVSNDTIVRGCL
jgi:ketosteroid isomerase-like protein